VKYVKFNKMMIQGESGDLLVWQSSIGIFFCSLDLCWVLTSQISCQHLSSNGQQNSVQTSTSTWLSNSGQICLKLSPGSSKGLQNLQELGPSWDV